MFADYSLLVQTYQFGLRHKGIEKQHCVGITEEFEGSNGFCSWL